MWLLKESVQETFTSPWKLQVQLYALLTERYEIILITCRLIYFPFCAAPSSWTSS
jgi:hypothetical protein